MGRRKGKLKLTRVLPELMEVYRYFWSDMRRKSGLIIGSFVALFFGVIFRLLEPWPLKFVLDQVFQPQSRPDARTITLPNSWTVGQIVLAVSVAVILIAVLRATADYISRVGFFKVGNYVVIRVRDRVYRHLQAMPMAFHDRAKHGDLITRVTRDVSLLRDVTATAILPLLGSSLVLVGMAAVMVWLNWKLAAVSLIIIPLYWATTVRLGRRIRETSRKQRQRESAMATIASEAIGSIRDIKALGLEEKFAADFDRKNNRSQSDELKSSRLSLRLGRTVDILLAFATAGVLWLGAHLVLAGTMYPGDLVVFLVYLKRSFKPAQEFAKYTARIAKATVAGERVIQLLERPVEPATGHLEMPGGPVAIEFRNVCFGYDKSQLILKDFNLRIDAGKMCAVVGPSGAGKSTLISLLLHFYQPNGGQILVDGQDIRNIKLDSLRHGCSVVLQSPLLFAATIAENIAFGARDPVDETEILKAARMAEVDEFALELPNGFDTDIAERSNTLSRGQRQRIAIARAFVADRPLLLLDEPTTGLDERNQQIVCDALIELAKGRTSIVVTHNLVLASRADTVAYVADGHVKQRGTHEELLAAEGPYAQLFQQQRNAMVDRPSRPATEEFLL